MKKITLFLYGIAGIAYAAKAQDTFSIVAADSATHEVGSAGASCVNLVPLGYTADFLSELFADTGAINSQASYLPANQASARTRMRIGDSPAQIINWVNLNDAGGDSTVRQYGIVKFVGGTAVAQAYTGTGCLDTKYHKIGKVNGIAYSIQGNILSGSHIIDSMESRFVHTSGNIKCRLMAALQGANEVGADSRCTTNGTSSMFSFIKVSQPTDAFGSPSFRLSVITDGTNGEPIDSLQRLFNNTAACSTPSLVASVNKTIDFDLFPNPAKNTLTVQLPTDEAATIIIYNSIGQKLYDIHSVSRNTVISLAGLARGLYYVSVSNKTTTSVKKMSVE